jgi:SAM-dependent methyltransferase
MNDPDPTLLLRVRDGVYAPDLLTAAVAGLDLFGWLEANGPCGEARIREELVLAPRPLDVTITYLVALGLLERSPDGRVGLTRLSAEFLCAGSPRDLRPYFASLRERPACRELLQVLRTGEPVAWASAGGGEDWAARLDDPAFARSITAAMDARGAALAPALADAIADLPFDGVLDIGGGSGVYVSALAGRRPEARAAVLERPPVDDAARTILRELGESRVEVVTGDMFGARLPDGFDLHVYSHVFHDWPEPEVRALLRSSFAALPPGGWLVDHDTHIHRDKTGPLPIAEYSVLLMHSTHGKCWSTGELGEMLADAGFAVHDLRPTAADRTALVARKPG